MSANQKQQNPTTTMAAICSLRPRTGEWTCGRAMPLSEAESYLEMAEATWNKEQPSTECPIMVRSDNHDWSIYVNAGTRWRYYRTP
jgi:hypothetical protein